jgi:hypothetical protein
MTSLLGAKKRAEEFAAAADNGQAATGQRPELAELVDVVSALRSVETPAPRAEFSAALRERLMAEAADTLATNATLTLPIRRHGARERRLAAAASVFVLVGGSAGMAAAAQNAIPGDALYPIKRSLERAEAGLSSGSAAKGRHLLDQADQRLTEVESLSAGSDVARLPDTVDAFTAQAQEGASLLMSSFEADRDPADIDSIRSFAADALDRLQDVAATAPASVQVQLTDAAVTLQRIDEAATAACSTCSDLPALKMPSMFLTAVDAGRALGEVKARAKELNNDHPLIAEPKVAFEPRVEDEAPAQELPEAPPQPDGGPAPDNPLGGVKVDGPQNTEDAAKKTKEVVDGLLKGVKDVAEPILPSELDPVLDTVVPDPTTD